MYKRKYATEVKGYAPTDMDKSLAVKHAAKVSKLVSMPEYVKEGEIVKHNFTFEPTMPLIEQAKVANDQLSDVTFYIMK